MGATTSVWRAICHTDALLWSARKIASMVLPAARERHVKNVWHIALRRLTVFNTGLTVHYPNLTYVTLLMFQLFNFKFFRIKKKKVLFFIFFFLIFKSSVLFCCSHWVLARVCPSPRAGLRTREHASSSCQRDALLFINFTCHPLTRGVPCVCLWLLQSAARRNKYESWK